jgi:peptidoglycan/xylan/chitin deacetylase (PgdA/CDA1 family)
MTLPFNPSLTPIRTTQRPPSESERAPSGTGTTDRVRDDERTGHEWPGDRRVYLTLDLECDFGTALSENVYVATEHTSRLAALLDRYDVPLTTFVQTELLDEHSEAVERLRAGGTDIAFHPHSHTHAKRGDTTSRFEITTSTDRFTEFFGERPTGYRFPNGNVRPSDYSLLAESGYRFDASVFPTWRPGHFNNVRSSTTPNYLADYDLFELPFTVYSDTLRVPTALSYCRLLGRPFVELLTRRPPGTVVLNVHMHDLVTPTSVHDLPALYRAIYARNDHGFELLARLVERFQRAGYTFETLNRAYEDLREQRT